MTKLIMIFFSFFGGVGVSKCENTDNIGKQAEICLQMSEEIYFLEVFCNFRLPFYFFHFISLIYLLLKVYLRQHNSRI